MKMLPTVLVTGFEPFDGQSSNPSWEAAQALQGKRIAGHRVVARRLPVAFGASSKALRNVLREVRPALVVCLGLAGGRESISLERVAINVDDARIADAQGRQPVDQAVVADGPAAYFTTLPIKSMLAGMRGAGFPVEVSQTAGTYVCNHVFYSLMHALRRSSKTRAGFIHVPYSTEQAALIAGAPGLALETLVEALRLAVRIAVTTTDDLRLAAGAEH